MDTTISNNDAAFFSDVIIQPPIEYEQWTTPDEMIAAHNEVRESAIMKLKKLGLTEDEAKAIIGNI